MLSKLKTASKQTHFLSTLTTRSYNFRVHFAAEKRTQMYETHLSWLIVGDAVVKYETKFINAFLTTRILVVFEFLLDLGHVHGTFYDGVIILKNHKISSQQQLLLAKKQNKHKRTILQEHTNR